MKIIKTASVSAFALGAMALGLAGIAQAGSLEPQGWTAGLALGTPLPEGAYFINNASVGGWRGIDDEKSNLVINVPLLAWSTPWTIAGARIEVLLAAPEIAGGVPDPVFSNGTAAHLPWSGRDYNEFYNPAGYRRRGLGSRPWLRLQRLHRRLGSRRQPAEDFRLSIAGC